MIAIMAIAIFFCPLLTGCTATASEILQAGTDPVVAPDQDFITYLLQSLNGIRGASIFASAGVIVQVVLRALDQPFAQLFFDRYKVSRLALTAALTFLITPIGLINGAGLTIGAALVHSSTLMAFLVFLNQVAVEYQKVKNDSRRQASTSE